MSSISCNLCDSFDSRPVFEIPDLWMERLDVTARYSQCTQCDLIYQNPRLSGQLLNQHYSNEYRRTQRLKTSFQNIGLKRRAQVLINNKESGVLLDLGCGNGEFLQYIRDHYRWDVVGLEIDRNLVETVIKTSDLNILCGSLEEIHFNYKFDAVTLWDTLEHLPDPSSTLLEIRRIIKPDGILIMRLPNLDSWDARLFGKYWAGYDSPRHLFVFNYKTITAMLMKTGFCVRDMHTNIGGYLNFVKSVQFWMTGAGFGNVFRRTIITVLKSVPLRIIGLLFTRIKDIRSMGSEMVVVAEPIK